MTDVGLNSKFLKEMCGVDTSQLLSLSPACCQLLLTCLLLDTHPRKRVVGAFTKRHCITTLFTPENESPNLSRLPVMQYRGNQEIMRRDFCLVADSFWESIFFTSETKNW